MARFQDRVIDAFFCTLGHPSETLRQLAAGSRQVRFIPIGGAGVDRLIAQQPYYSKTTIRVADHYPWAADAVDIPTFGVKAVLCASAQISNHVVYTLTKEVFENLESFKKQHPALASLNKAEMLTGFAAPLHPGAAAYFKEVGLLK